MILVTTRFPKIVEMVTKATDPIDLKGLEPDEFWIFFQVCVFGEIIQDEHDKEDLIDIGRQIASKLKCSPLAAKTVGWLLSKKPSREHWVEILEKKEWLNQKHGDDIIPALKISYDYLPFHLKKCFSYCALFPEDYKFDNLEISRFWISIGIIDSSGQNVKIEDIGSKYLDELLDNGFLMKGDDNYYVMHDLMHELSQSVSSKECAYISCSSFRADDIPSSIRYLSILIENNYIENFGEEMDKLKRRIDIGNLRSLMIFGEYRRASVVNVFKDTFREIEALRVLFIFMNSLNSLPLHFSKLVHLRYLKLKSPHYSEVCLPSMVSRFYHLRFLDLQNWNSSYALPKDISNLVNLCQFIARKEFQFNVPGVGKMKHLQELKEFHVKKESTGFELRELGQLEVLGGELNICGLENVRTGEEANGAKLTAKKNLIMLGLVWGVGQKFTGDDILDSLQPHSNLRELNIVNHGGASAPSWLCSKIQIKNLEVLHLEGVCWVTLPPIGQIYHLRKLKLKKIVGICQFGSDFIGGITEKSFKHLKEVEFDDMPELVEWVGGANSHLFSRLERISCNSCPKLTALPLSGWSCSSAQDNTIWFPNLCSLYAKACPKLCLPPLPHSSKLSSFQTDYLHYECTKLYIKMSSELAFHNLGEVEDLTINDAALISFADLQKLHPLRSIEIMRCQETFLRGLADGVVLHSVQSLKLQEFPLTRKSVPNLFKCFPGLSRLDVCASDEDHEEVVLQFPSTSSLRNVRFNRCKNLVLPVEDGGGFQDLLLMESVSIANCGRLFSQWSMREAAQSINPFPCCLKELDFWDESSTMAMALLSNLTSLTTLGLRGCKNLTVDGFNPLTTFNMTDLYVYNSRRDETEPYSIAVDLLAEVARTKPMPVGSIQLVRLQVDSISAVLVAPICSLL
ncbi:putative disease resistance protein RGA1 [Dichanthelium oligosanthes]|uniref:Putative disease resistance protein RGA1 n=1 Tax=Dichanthelium oligosanthes TaxID=888268 RepID=A0A1E5W0I7_9POAL|nr:putative disease resistance protein RGA1 [Dichanthelium oligosanthes]